MNLKSSYVFSSAIANNLKNSTRSRAVTQKYCSCKPSIQLGPDFSLHVEVYVEPFYLCNEKNYSNGDFKNILQINQVMYTQCVFISDLKLPAVTARGHLPAPGQLYGFPPCIQLPMKAVMMNPFPTELDQYDPQYTLQPPVLLMLKTSQKYFVHDRSYIPQESYSDI